MPWHIEKRAGKFVVIQSDNKRVVGTHPSRRKAEKHIAALKINVGHR